MNLPAAVAALAALVALLVLVVAGTAAAQEADDSFVAEPVPGSQMAPDGGYFLLDASPGEQVRQSIGLRNDDDEALELRLGAVDATTGQLGGVSYGLTDDTVERTGAWITLERSTVTLEPGASAIVAFTVTVPDDARSGTHLAGLSIAAPARGQDDAESGEGQAGASVDVQTRRVIAVQVDLPGPARPELVVGGVTAEARPDGLYLEIDIENRGGALTTADGSITVGDDFEHAFSVDTFVPGTSIGYPVKWTGEAVEGEHEASVELRYGDETVTWSGTFEVGEDTLEELGQRQVAPPAPNGDSSGSALPVTAIVGALAAVAALLFGGVYMIRRRRRSDGEQLADQRSPEPDESIRQ